MSRLVAYAIALAAVLALLVGGTWWYGHSRYKAGYTAAEAAMQALVDEANRQAIDTEKAAQGRVDTLEKSHAEAITDLDARLAAALKRAPVVRVQKCPDSGAVPPTPADAGERPVDPDGSGSDRENGIDLAPVLLRYSRDAEELRLGLKTCKAYGMEIERFRESLNQH